MTDVWVWPRAIVVATRSEPTGVHDGDTFYADVDQGRGTHWIGGPIRLAGINAPELNDPDPVKRGMAVAARDYLRSLLPLGTLIHLESVGYDKYGDRVDAIVTRTADSLNVNDEMVSSGHAVVKIY